MNASSRFELVVHHAGETQRRVLEGTLILGRGESAGLRIEEPSLSREHCRFDLIDGRMRVTDLGSQNGTFVNGQEISQFRLSAGDVVEFGARDVRAVVTSAPVASPTTSTPELADELSSPPPLRRPAAAVPEASPKNPPAPSDGAGIAASPRSRRRGPHRPTGVRRAGRERLADAAPFGAAPAPAARTNVPPPAPPEAVTRSTPSEPVIERRPEPKKPRVAAPSRVAVPSRPEPDPAASVSGVPASPVDMAPASPTEDAVAPVSGRARGPRGVAGGPNLRKPIALGVGGLLVVALVIAVVRGAKESARTDHVLDIVNQSRAAITKGDQESAQRLLAELVTTHGDVAEAGPARKLLSEVNELLSHRAAAREKLELVLLQNADVPGSVMLERARSVYSEHPDAIPSEEISRWDARIREFAEQRSSALLSAVRPGIQADINGQYFALAIEKIADAAASPLLFGRATTELEQLKDAVQRGARRAYGDLTRSLDSKSQEVACRELDRALLTFRGTVHEGEIRARLALLSEGNAAALVSDAGSNEARSDAAASSTPPPNLLKELAKIEGLVASRHYGEAAKAMRSMAEEEGNSRRSALMVRAERMERLAALKSAIIGAVARESGRFREVDFGVGRAGRILEADQDKLVLSVGPGARATWPWERVDSGRMGSLLARMTLRGEQVIAGAELFLELSDRERALAFLAKRYESETALRERMQPLVAEARRMARPDGGFELFEGAFLTTEEKVVAVRDQKIKRLSSEVVSAAPSAWSAPASGLREMGDVGLNALTAALRQRIEASKEKLSTVPALSGRGLAATRERLFADLESRRKEALALINDSVKYPYPYADNQKEIQAEVDTLVRRVEDIWERPALAVIEKDADLKALHDDAVAADALLVELGGTTLLSDFIASAHDRIGMRTYTGNASAKDLLSHYQEVQAFNDSQTELLGEVERGVLDLTNAYRVMLGVRAVMTDDRIVTAARGHSQEMQDLGYFAHQSPTAERKNPSMRANLAGWSGGVSENILRGSRTPHAILSGWLHSSGHHRNIVGGGHTHLGVGGSSNGEFWTQNFGRGRATPPKGAKPRQAPGKSSGTKPSTTGEKVPQKGEKPPVKGERDH